MSSGPRLLIVGGVAGGASAATRARRMSESAEIVMFEKGEHVSFANCGLPYHIGGQIAERPSLLVSTPEEFRGKFNIDVRTQHEVMRIDRAGHRVEVKNLRSDKLTWERYDKLILAPGASPIVPPWNGVRAPNVFTLRDVADTDRIKAWIDAGQVKRAVVIGAGFIGLEMVESLVHRGAAVSVIELQPQVLPPVDQEIADEMAGTLRAHGVELYLGGGVENLVEHDGRVAVRMSDGHEVPADLVLISIGVRPNTGLASDAGLTLGASGGIAVDEHLRTSDPDIYAVGDAAEVMHLVTGQATRIPLAGSANRNGRLAGEHAVTGTASKAAPVAGTAIVGLFDKAVAMTGLSAKAAAKASIPFAVAYAQRGHHAGYYPGAELMILKLIYEPHSGRLLGGQAVGGAGVDKRIDVLATVLRFGGTIDDVAGLDLAYAPQFGSAKDPLHIAAFVAMNQRDGLVRQIQPGEPSPAGQLVDVRDESEFLTGSLPGARNIPLHRLREQMDQLKRDEPVLVYCQVGQRGYNAARILSMSGFREVWNLSGGYRLHQPRWENAPAGVN